MQRPQALIALTVASLFTFAAASRAATLVAHYDFNESAGPTLNDSAGADANGTTANVTFSASGAGVGAAVGTFGNAGTFDGTSSDVNFGANPPADFNLGTGDFTITGWFKTDTIVVNTEESLFSSANTSSAGGGFDINIRRADRSNRGTVFFTLYGGGNSAVFGLTQVFSDVRLDDNAWHWIAITAASGTDGIRMYVDGVLQADTGTKQAGSTGTAPSGTVARFGASSSGSLRYPGQLDEWRIYTGLASSTVDGSNVLTGGELYDIWRQNVPEPASLGLLGLGGLVMFVRRGR